MIVLLKVDLRMEYDNISYTLEDTKHKLPVSYSEIDRMQTISLLSQPNDNAFHAVSV